MVTATVNGTPRRAWRASTTGCKRHVVPCSREVLSQPPQALGGLGDGPDVFWQDNRVRRGGTHDFREPPEMGRAPIGPARRADIVAEQERFHPERGVFESADDIFARPRALSERFIVHVRDVH